MKALTFWVNNVENWQMSLNLWVCVVMWAVFFLLFFLGVALSAEFSARPQSLIRVPFWPPPHPLDVKHGCNRRVCASLAAVCRIRPESQDDNPDAKDYGSYTRLLWFIVWSMCHKQEFIPVFLLWSPWMDFFFSRFSDFSCRCLSVDCAGGQFWVCVQVDPDRSAIV